MITLFYAIFGRGLITEYALTGLIDFLIQGILFLALVGRW